MKDTSRSVKFENKSKEKQVNDFIALNLNQNAGKLINQSTGLINKFKNLNEELKEIIHLEKDLKMKEMVTGNKLLELMNLERRLKDKSTK
jgi:predicted patatin/cPLA2 family phospholipase